MSFWLADNFKLFLSGQKSLLALLQTSDYYPPFIQSIGAILSLIFGYNSEALVYFGLVILIGSIYMVYKLAFLITQNQTLALNTAIIFSLFPHIYDQSRAFHLDLPLVLLILLSLYFLLKSEFLTNTKYSYLFFIMIGLTQLTKWYGFIYIAPTSIYLAIKYFKDSQKKPLNYSNILFGIVVTLMISAPWYIANQDSLIKYSAIFSTPETDDPAVFLSFENFSYYFNRIVTFQILLLPAIFVILGALKVFKNNSTGFWISIFNILLPISIFTFISNKNLRYLLPLTPLFAFLISYYIEGFKRIYLKKITYIFLLLYLASSYLYLSYNHVEPFSFTAKFANRLLAGPYDGWKIDPQAYSYTKGNWHVEEIMDFIVADANVTNNFALGITPLIDQKNFSLSTVEMLRREKHLSNVFIPAPYFRFEPYSNDNETLGYFNENSVSYIISPESPGNMTLRNYEVLAQMIEYLNSSRNKAFVVVKNFSLPDGSDLNIYRRADFKSGNPNNDNSNHEVETPIKEIGGQPIEYCIEKSGQDDGLETIKLEKNFTYVLSTGHFALDKYKYDFIEGNIYIVQLENRNHESLLNVYNLPLAGSSLCARKGINLNLSEELSRPLTQSGQCGVDCQTVTYIKWEIGNPEDPIVERFERNIGIVLQ